MQVVYQLLKEVAYQRGKEHGRAAPKNDYDALLRMLTATGQNQGISHGLQIGKDQDDSSQDTDHGCQFNNIGFIENMSILAETPEGMQTLLDVVQEFTT